MNPPVSVSIVDDHILVREGLASTLRENPRLHVVGTFSSLAEFCDFQAAAVGENRTSLLLLDLDLDGGAADPRVVEGLIEGGLSVLVVSAMGWPSLVREMVIAGVSGFVAKRDPTQSLLTAIETVIDGGSWNSSELAAILADSPVRPALSIQEERALQLYATGLKMSSVARQMGVQNETAKDYIDRVRKKYAASGRDVRSKTELYIAAVADGLIKPGQHEPGQPEPSQLAELE